METGGSDLRVAEEYSSHTLPQALNALHFIVPLLEKTGKPWIITGGFATYVYGVDRPIYDIDIDIDCAHDDAVLVDFLSGLNDYITQPLIHLQSDEYDNYNFEATIDGVIIDCCPGKDLNLFDPVTGRHEPAYKDGFPTPTMVPFHGFILPLLAKETIIEQKSQLQRPIDLTDIAGLRILLQPSLA